MIICPAVSDSGLPGNVVSERMAGMMPRIRKTAAAAVVAAVLAGCSSMAAEPRRDSSTGGGSSAGRGVPASARAKAPCAQIPLAMLNAAFKTSFSAGTVDNTLTSLPSCNWTGKTFDLSLSLIPALASDYDDELEDTSDTSKYERTQPKFGNDSTFSVDTDRPDTTTLSVLTDDLEWLIDADSVGAGAGDGRAELLSGSGMSVWPLRGMSGWR